MSERDRKAKDGQEINVVSRRSFLNVGLASAAASLTILNAQASPAEAGIANSAVPPQKSGNQEILPSVPKLVDLASDRLVRHFRGTHEVDYFEPQFPLQ